ncbi:hypothetical protein OHT61_11990 [Streptomyces sp. NBC_00178]|uniref:hypothetical protein n=1 Tax=Streptomyces sp. NBC_00178 TaxID=2975672 RepID=UPI002E27E85A|nr:hypothetical protein [Streptomyces sp. NBC_00178]
MADARTDQDQERDQDRGTRRKVVVDLVVIAVLLLPPLFSLWMSAADAREHLSTDWEVNHRAKESLQRYALLIVGLPVGGALCGWITAVLRDRPAPLPTVRGMLAGTLTLWVLGIVSFVGALGRLTNP